MRPGESNRTPKTPSVAAGEALAILVQDTLAAPAVVSGYCDQAARPTLVNCSFLCR